MSTIVRISAEGLATIPQEIREALAVQPGDLVEWEITGDGRVEVRRSQAADAEYLGALPDTLSEWRSKEDDEAYAGL